MNQTDDELLAIVGAAFAPEPLEPPARSIAALRRSVAEQHIAPARRRAAVWQHGARRGSVLLAAGGLVVGGATAAAAATGHLPQPIRSLAHELGLSAAPKPRPTIPSQLGDLRAALAHKDETKARQLIRSLQRSAAHLDDAERVQLNAQIGDTLHPAGHETPRPAISGEPAPNHPGTDALTDTPGTPADTSATNPSDTQPTDLPTSPSSEPAPHDSTVTPAAGDPSKPTPPTETASAPP